MNRLSNGLVVALIGLAFLVGYSISITGPASRPNTPQIPALISASPTPSNVQKLGPGGAAAAELSIPDSLAGQETVRSNTDATSLLLKDSTPNRDPLAFARMILTDFNWSFDSIALAPPAKEPFPRRSSETDKLLAEIDRILAESATAKPSIAVGQAQPQSIGAAMPTSQEPPPSVLIQNSKTVELGQPLGAASHSIAENGSYYGQPSAATGRPKTVHVEGYYRQNGTYVQSHFRSAPRHTGSIFASPTAYQTTRYGSGIAENGSYYGQISVTTGRPKTVHVQGYYRKDGTYVRGHYRSTPRR